MMTTCGMCSFGDTLKSVFLCLYIATLSIIYLRQKCLACLLRSLTMYFGVSLPCLKTTRTCWWSVQNVVAFTGHFQLFLLIYTSIENKQAFPLYLGEMNSNLMEGV